MGLPLPKHLGLEDNLNLAASVSLLGSRFLLLGIRHLSFFNPHLVRWEKEGKEFLLMEYFIGFYIF